MGKTGRGGNIAIFIKQSLFHLSSNNFMAVCLVVFFFLLFEVSKLKISQGINIISQKRTEIFCGRSTWVSFDFSAYLEHSTRIGVHCSAPLSLVRAIPLFFTIPIVPNTAQKQGAFFCCWTGNCSHWSQWHSYISPKGARSSPSISKLIYKLLLDSDTSKVYR